MGHLLMEECALLMVKPLQDLAPSPAHRVWLHQKHAVLTLAHTSKPTKQRYFLRLLKLFSSSCHKDRFLEGSAFATFLIFTTLQICVSGPCSEEATFVFLETQLRVSLTLRHHYSHGGTAGNECADHSALWVFLTRIQS